MPNLLQKSIAEVIGTFILILFGCGAVHAAVLTNAQTGIWQVAIVWGMGVTLAVYVVGGISGAHINPAITIALATWGKFPWREVPSFIGSQLAGAFLAAAALFFIYGPQLAQREADKGIKRDGPGGFLTAMCYGEFYPNPAPIASNKERFDPAEWEKMRGNVTHAIAFTAEVLATAMLALVVFAVTDPRNEGGPPARLAPVFIGLTVALLISIIGPLTQCCLNPARDFGPRLFTFLAGWKTQAIPGPNGIGVFTVYILAPTLGAVAGGGVYEQWLRHFLPSPVVAVVTKAVSASAAEPAKAGVSR
jgi:glycerol uptake facilitator protein